MAPGNPERDQRQFLATAALSFSSFTSESVTNDQCRPDSCRAREPDEFSHAQRFTPPLRVDGLGTKKLFDFRPAAGQTRA
jgi:hypothetical protein